VTPDMSRSFGSDETVVDERLPTAAPKGETLSSTSMLMTINIAQIKTDESVP
jgi:hypothetical protein